MIKWKSKITNKFKKLSFNKKMGWELLSYTFLLILICFSFEKDSINDFIKLIWYEPIVQHIDKSLIGLIFSAIGLVCIFSSFIYLKKESVLIYLSIGVSLIYFRTSDFWELIEFVEITFIPFIIPMYSLLKILVSKKTDNQDSLNFGIPDSFKRTNFARSIVEEINFIKVENLKGSFNYGLIGEWGSGKTFLLNMIHEEMKKDESIIATFYKPWETPKEDHFYKEIISRLKDQSNSNDIISILHKYSLNLEANSQDFVTSTVASLSLWFTGKRASIEILKKDISDLLQKKQKKMVVFLDDLDRLEEHEIKEVLRLLRNTFDIPCLFFIVGFDREYISKTLNFNDKNQNKFDKYIAKFFQVRVNIPKIESHNLQENYFRKLKSFGIDLDVDDSQIPQIIGDRILELLKTPRDYENVFGSFRTVYNNLKHECDWVTLLQLEIIRQKEYLLYSIMQQGNYKVLLKNPELIEKWIDEQKTYYSSKEELLTEIRQKSEIYGKYHITDPFYYSKYFTYVNGEDEISDNKFKEVFETTNLESIYRHIRLWSIQGKKDDLHRKIDDFLRNCKLEKSPEFLITIDMNLEKGVNKSYVNQSILAYINRIFSEMGVAAGFDFMNDLKKQIPKDRVPEMFEFYFFTNNLEQFTSEFLDKLDEIIIDESRVINQKLYTFINKFYFFINGNYANQLPSLISFSKISDSEKEITYDAIDNKVYNFAKSDIKSFLLNFIISVPQFQDTAIYAIFSEYIPKLLNFDECLSLLSKLPKDEANEELTDFIQKLKENNSKSIMKLIPYDWKYNDVLTP